jgi:transcription elongation factor GreA
MNTKKMYLTKEGLEDLKKEYDDLANQRRPEVVRRLAAAREMGDLSENAEYHAAREELSFIDGRIDELEELLKQVEVIDETVVASASGNQVQLGSRVTVKQSGKQIVYNLVGEWEADPAEKKISHESPLGKALLGKKIGQTIEVNAPAGKIAYTVEDIN